MVTKVVNGAFRSVKREDLKFKKNYTQGYRQNNLTKLKWNRWNSIIFNKTDFKRWKVLKERVFEFSFFFPPIWHPRFRFCPQTFISFFFFFEFMYVFVCGNLIIYGIRFNRICSITLNYFYFFLYYLRLID